MYLPYDEELGIHPQDDAFLELEPWDFANTPPERYPLLLYFHPLVIYRYQVLKQADVVLAMFLRGDQFTLEQKRRNFDYYDPITTGDSSLSACVQAVAAAQIGYDDVAVDYFREALFVDLADTHGNTTDGVHIASAGGVWGTIVFGFAGLFDSGTSLRFTPSLPAQVGRRDVPDATTRLAHARRHRRRRLHGRGARRTVRADREQRPQLRRARRRRPVAPHPPRRPCLEERYRPTAPRAQRPAHGARSAWHALRAPATGVRVPRAGARGPPVTAGC